MSWINKIENVKFSIKTGDGKEFFPLWKPGEKTIEYNTSSFDFIDVEKSLVERKKPKSGKYPLTFWFQGDDNIEQAQDFEDSAKDNRYWTVTHPFYGSIKGQPLSISRNDSNYNITEITVDFWETIVFDYPKSNLSIQDNTLVKRDSIMSNSALAYSSKNVQKTEDIQKNKESNALVAKSFETIQSDETNVDYQNSLAKAQKSSENLLTNPNQAILDSQSLLSGPSFYDVQVLPKINAYKTAFNTLFRGFDSVADKLFFESQGATCLANLCNASVNYDYETDYKIISDVNYVSDIILELYNNYLILVDGASVSNYDIDNNYQPNPIVQSELHDLVMFTIANLFDLAFDAQQERVVYLPKDSNLVLLTHKYMGLANDENMQRFREINNIKLKELFRIKKGRKIKYYV
jgi:hypothetical protein